MENNNGQIRGLLNVRFPMLIPPYQREFVWSDLEGTDFFDDLRSSDTENPLFIGTFIFSLEKNGGPLEIVDGQQRITTILIFLIACRVFAKKKDYSTNLIEAVQSQIQTQSMSSESPKCCLSTKGRIGKSLKIMSRSDWSGEYEKEMGNKHGWNRARKAYKFFYEEFNTKEYTENDIRELVDKLLDVEYIGITVRGEEEAISTFERVNARGQHLAVYDLIKAYLFSRELDNPELDDIESYWEDIREYAEDSDGKLKKLLYSFYFSKKGYVLPSKLYKNLKDIAKSNIKNFVSELEAFAKFYSILSTKEDKFEARIKKHLLEEVGLKGTKIDDQNRMARVVKSLYSLRLFKVISVYPLIYASLLSLKKNIGNAKEDGKKQVDEWISLIEFLEKFSFVVTRITHKSSLFGGKLQTLYSKYCISFTKGENDFIKIVKELKEDFAAIKVNEEEFIEAFKDLSYDNKNDKEIIYYIFSKLNSININEEPIEPSNLPDFFTPDNYKTMGNNIEHLSPQKPKDGRKPEENVHDIGNLLVIHRKQNSKLGNDEPKEKVAKIKKWLDESDIWNKPYLEIFVNDFEKNCPAGKEWDSELIDDRSEEIAKKIFKIMKYAA